MSASEGKEFKIVRSVLYLLTAVSPGLFHLLYCGLENESASHENVNESDACLKERTFLELLRSSHLVKYLNLNTDNLKVQGIFSACTLIWMIIKQIYARNVILQVAYY